MVRDVAAEIEGLMGQVRAGEIGRVEAALERRRRELGLGRAEKPGGTKPDEAARASLSGMVEYRAHEDGTLQAEVRRHVRKDGTASERGPYWYFKYNDNGRRRSIYLGKTDDPEGVLASKRAASAGETH